LLSVLIYLEFRVSYCKYVSSRISDSEFSDSEFRPQVEVEPTVAAQLYLAPGVDMSIVSFSGSIEQGRGAAWHSLKDVTEGKIAPLDEKPLLQVSDWIQW
jgi:hypothetical protein